MWLVFAMENDSPKGSRRQADPGLVESSQEPEAFGSFQTAVG
jgi:hypothetical protein